MTSWILVKMSTKSAVVVLINKLYKLITKNYRITKSNNTLICIAVNNKEEL